MLKWWNFGEVLECFGDGFCCYKDTGALEGTAKEEVWNEVNCCHGVVNHKRMMGTTHFCAFCLLWCHAMEKFFWDHEKNCGMMLVELAGFGQK